MDINVDCLKRHERDAWATVYEALADRVYHYALYRLHGDRQAAEEMAQEVFLRAIESIATYHGDAEGLLRWLKGIARRIISRRIRDLRPAAARPLSLDGPAPRGGVGPIEVADRKPLSPEQLTRHEEDLMVGAALTALPAHWESALRWKYQEETSVAEIARRLGISTKAAESLLGRARHAFRVSYQRLLDSGGRLCDVEDWNDE